jgi:hypothetical protein
VDGGKSRTTGEWYETKGKYASSVPTEIEVLDEGEFAAGSVSKCGIIRAKSKPDSFRTPGNEMPMTGDR